MTKMRDSASGQIKTEVKSYDIECSEPVAYPQCGSLLCDENVQHHHLIMSSLHCFSFVNGTGAICKG